MVPFDLYYRRQTGRLKFALWHGVNISLARFASQETRLNISLIIPGWRFGCVVVVGSPYSP